MSTGMTAVLRTFETLRAVLEPDYKCGNTRRIYPFYLMSPKSAKVQLGEQKTVKYEKYYNLINYRSVK